MSKELKAKVTLDVTSATKKLEAIAKSINSIDKAINKAATSSTGKLASAIEKATKSTLKLDKANQQASKSAAKITKNYQKSSTVVSGLTKKVKGLAATYLGIMGARAVFTTSDIITSTENKLNALNGNNTGMTQDTMDKMYTSAQKTRMGYADMMSNVSKSMTLAPNAFQGNIDNAIRFQEIMSEAYTLGGASAAEQSSSMYQMIQALGSGRLQGDELRSVREGAPLAYKAIEEFAQGVYGADQNLKDLASQGKITSDIVVAAMMNAGESMDEAFAKTDMTFAQALLNIKNSAIKAFEPVLQMLNDALNSGAVQSLLKGISIAFQVIGKAILIVFNFIANNWSIISKILIVLGTILGVYVAYQIGLLIGSLVKLLWQSSITVGTMIAEFIVMGQKLGWATAMSIMFGISMNMWAWIALAVLAVIIIVLIAISDSFVDAAGNIIGAIYTIGAWFKNVFYSMLNNGLGVSNALIAIWENIKIAFINAFLECKAKFWDFVSTVYSGVLKVANLINKVLGVFGLEIDTSSLETAVNVAKSKAEENRSKKLEYTDVIAAYNQGASTFSTWEEGWATNAFNKGYKVGEAGGQWVVDKVNGIKNSITGGSLSSIDPGGYTIPGVDDMTNGIGDTADNTGRMADSMELAEDDLAYLRKVANMEWKKEFTTATIKVDMSNYNTINNDADLDGIATRLADKLYEEMGAVANGVYA